MREYVPGGKFEALYLDNRPSLISRVARKIGSHAVAAELVHDVFLRLWERRSEIPDHEGAYLGRSINNAVVDYLRAERVRKDYVQGVLPE